MGAQLLASAALFLVLGSRPASATPAFGSFVTEQCDGTLKSGSFTNRDRRVQVQQTVQDLNGLKVGQTAAPMILSGATGAFFRFDDGYQRHLATGAGAGFACPGGLGGSDCISLTYWDRDHDISATPRGLLGEYYADPDLAWPIRMRTDPKIEFDYGRSSAIIHMPADNFSARWSGMVKTNGAGNYDFKVFHDDGARLYFNNAMVLDEWGSCCTTHTYTANGLAADTLYPIVLEFRETGGPGYVKLSWSGPGITGTEIIPTSRLYSNPTSAIIGRCVYKKGASNGNYNYQAAVSVVPPVTGGCPASVSSATAASNIFTTGTPPGTTGNARAAYGSNYNAFNGSSFHMVPENPQLDLPGTYTLSAWIKSTAGTAFQRIFSQQNGVTVNPDGAGGYWGFGLDDNGRPRSFDSRGAPFDWRTSNPVTAPGGTCPDLRDSQWHYIAVSRDTVSRRVNAYVDGRLCASTATVAGADFSSNTLTAAAIIGAYSGDNGASSSEWFSGYIDELRLAYDAVDEKVLFTEYTATLHDHQSPPGSNLTRTFYGVSGVNYPTSGLPNTSDVIAGAAHGTTGSVNYRPPLLDNLDVSSQTVTFYAAGTDQSAVSVSRLVVLAAGPPDAPSLAGDAVDVDKFYWRFSPGTSYCKGNAYLVGTFGATYNAFYDLYTRPADTVVQALTLPTAAPAPENMQLVETVVGAPNTPYTRAAKMRDHYGTSAFSPSVTLYTRAAPPRLLSVSNVSTGSFVISWDANNNPSYTRYVLDYTLDNDFASPIDAVTLGMNLTATNSPQSNLAPGTTYYFRVRAYNGQAADSSGVAYSTGAFITVVTLTTGPTLSASVLGTTSLRWTWTQVPGALGYRLYDAVTNAVIAQTPAVIAIPPNMRYDQTGLSTNTLHAAYVRAYNNSGEGLIGNVASLYTSAASIPNAFYRTVTSTTIGLEWAPSENPGYTLYEVQVASDSAYSIVIATKVYVSTTGAVSGLFPGTTYFMRVRGLSGSQEPTPYRDALSTATLPDPQVSQAVAPGSPYVLSNDLLGLWHFDEGSGTTSADATGRGYAAGLYCRGSAVQCLSGSTPTWSGGAPALGSGILLTGLNGGLAEIPSAPLTGTGSLTLSVWAKPSTLSQPESAGLVVKGPMNGESFALDVTTGPGGLMYYRFKPKPGALVVVATSSLRLSQWDHVVGTFDGVTARLFINGSNQASALVAGPRLNNGSVTTVGCRQSGSTLYDRCFAGGLDDVRAYNRALSAPEVLSLFQSHSTNTFTPATPAGLQIILPPNAFPASTNIYATGDPLSHPIHVQPGLLAMGLLNAPTGQALVPGSLVEIVPTIAGQAFTGTLGSSATLVFPFADSDGDGIIDGTRPPIPASTVRVYTLDTTILRWEPLATSLDAANRRISARTSHFSIFAQFGASTVGTGASSARAYPVPWEPGGSGPFGAPLLTFETLPPSGRIAIFNLSGEKIIELPFQSSDAGRKTWDGRNHAGRKVASGLYMAHIKASDGGTAFVRVVIER